MFKRFDNYGKALEAARVLSQKHNVPIDVILVYKGGNPTCSLLASPSKSHLLPKYNRCHPVTGFYFGEMGVTLEEHPELNEYPESDVFDEAFEKAYWLVSCRTVGNVEQKTAIARLLVENKTCVWHECARYYGHLATCACAKCVKARVKVA